MRINTRNVEFFVRLCEASDSPRPVVLRLGGITYSMNTPEALELANQLANAVDELRNTNREEKP
jgi:hypothetical protein